MDLKGKSVLLTGGTDGIGKALALQLKERGAAVLIVGRNTERCEAMRSVGFEVVQVDLVERAGLDAVVAVGRARAVDVLVNNAGAYDGYDPDDPATIDDADRLLTLNLLRPIALTTALLPQMRSLPEAMVVNVTSGLAIAPNGNSVYCASKSGLRVYSMSLRHHLRGTGVHVLEALPPDVDTKMNKTKTKKITQEECARQILSAMVRGADEANVGMVKVLRAIYSFSPALARKVMRDA
jgi:uncharacterized oxidoreductase